MSKALRALIRHGVRRGLPSRAGFSRRDFLRTGLAAAAAALPAGLTGCRGKARRPVKPLGLRVVVIGAGFGGLACADTLADAGAAVTVLEATNRAGGRVVTDRKFLPGDPVELGGEWIGSNHPTWLGYAKKFKLELEEPEGAPEESDSVIVLNGEALRGAKADELFAEVDEALAQVIAIAKNVDPTRPYARAGAADLDKQSFADFVNGVENLSDRAKTLLITSEEADNGVPADRMSMLAFLAMVAGGGLTDYFESSEVYRLKSGNDALASALAKKLGDRVRVNAPAAKVYRSPTGAIVTTGSGEAVECDVVVLAIPPSVWDRVAFDPPLDPALRPQMGRNVKLLLSLKEPVWLTDGTSDEVVSDGLVNLTWAATQPKPKRPVALTLFSGAADADALRALDPAARRADAVASIAGAYPGLAAAVAADRFVDWPGMPLVKASYSFPAPGQVTGIGETIVEGVRDSRAPLRFVGEHASFAFPGYMEGALSSGVRVANDLIRAAKDVAVV